MLIIEILLHYSIKTNCFNINLKNRISLLIQTIIYIILVTQKMTSAFTGSRLANFRQKKSGDNQETEFKLTLPSDNDRSGYQPTANFNNTRTSMRMLKGRIQKGGAPGQKPPSNPTIQAASNNQISIGSSKKLVLPQQPTEGLKLVINDSPLIQKKKYQQPVKQPDKKRIMIAKEQPPVQKQQEVKKQSLPPPVQPKVEQVPIPSLNKNQINEEQLQESKDQAENQNDLVQCPEGCGRKFNRKALQKHAKACKTVFMSKRKQFNSQAKRFASKEQAQIVRQNKIRQKSQMGKTKGQGQFGKTGDNWKVASQDFRAVLKGIKKNEGEQGQQQQKMVTCTFCQKLFNEVFLQKHIENCVKRREKQKKSAAKKKR